jgi:hypothetical protein
MLDQSHPFAGVNDLLDEASLTKRSPGLPPYVHGHHACIWVDRRVHLTWALR